MRFKFFRKGTLSRLFDSFISIFSDDSTTQFIVGGIIFTLIGVTILWLSVKPNLFNSGKDII
ncbi:hypothetical protein [Flavobacterium pectinovorum]|nr:hypothetical protein [Flavobacterium pectinovorum]